MKAIHPRCIGVIVTEVTNSINAILPIKSFLLAPLPSTALDVDSSLKSHYRQLPSRRRAASSLAFSLSLSLLPILTDIFHSLFLSLSLSPLGSYSFSSSLVSSVSSPFPFFSPSLSTFPSPPFPSLRRCLISL